MLNCVQDAAGNELAGSVERKRKKWWTFASTEMLHESDEIKW
jgi:hypothetical protein